MHEAQKKLISLVQLVDLNSLSYRQIAERIGVSYASQVKHHLEQLEKRGYLVRRPNGKFTVAAGRLNPGENNVFMIPLLGEADCGEATKFATDHIRGYLTVSPSATSCKNIDDVFALQARGNSMNMARINGRAIEDSDFILVKRCTAFELSDGDYVVSVINGLANVKKYNRDELHGRIVLTSESTERFLPIIIAEEDLEYYHPVGKVTDVIKGTNHLD